MTQLAENDTRKPNFKWNGEHQYGCPKCKYTIRVNIPQGNYECPNCHSVSTIEAEPFYRYGVRVTGSEIETFQHTYSHQLPNP